jgi:D-alanine-D-alanine ligase
MRIGIAFDLKEDFKVPEGREDLLEEYDSIDTVRAIRNELERLGHKVSLLHSGRRFLDAILQEPVDLVFNIAEGSGGRCREAHIPALCEMMRVPFTHSDALTLSLSLDKGLAMQVAKSAGLPTPFQYIVHSREEIRELIPPLPVIIKPQHEGSSMGIRNDCLIRSHEALRDGAKRLLDMYRQPVIVEEFLPGKELTVGILGNRPPEIIGVMEIAPVRGTTENFLYSIETKRDYRRLVSYACPPTGLPEATIVEAGRIALKTFELFGCCDIARVDLRLDGKGHPRLLEINPLPGLSPVYSDLCIMASLVRLPYGKLIESILDAAIERLGLNDGHRSKKSKKKRQTVSSSPYPEFRRLQ